MLTIDMITKMTPNMAIYLPENSLPNINQRSDTTNDIY
jgi:hypothetical protein